MRNDLEEQTLRRWAAQSSGLDERTSGVLAGGDLEASAALWANWRRIAAKNDASRFDAYSRHAGWCEDRILPFLGDVSLPGDLPLPEWSRELPGLVTKICEGAAAHAPDPSIPFASLFQPLGEAVAARACQDWTGHPFAASAREAVAHELVRRLCAAFRESLLSWFDAFRRVQSEAAGKTVSPQSTEIYDAFLTWLRGGQFARLLDRFPVLARLLATTVAQVEQHMEELSRRFAADRPRMLPLFFDGRDPGSVTTVELGISDPHNHGRGVAILHFANGERLVYKPHDLSIDLAWDAFLARMRVIGVPADLSAPKVLAGDGYGWTGFIAFEPCANEIEVRAFFRRSGHLLGLFQMLGASDFHEENVIACRDQPTPVDLETLLRPLPLQADDGEHPARQATKRLLQHSILESGYLPYWNQFRNIRWVGGALGWYVPEASVVTGCQHPNTDAMCIGPVPLPATPLTHLPSLDGTVCDPLDHIAEIEVGLAATSSALIAHRDAVNDALDVFQGAAVRPVLRSTQLYANLANRTLQPDKLVNGAAYELEFEFLARLHEPDDPLSGDQVRAERQALARLDIPLFRMPAQGGAIVEAGGGVLAASDSAFTSPLEHARRRLAALDPVTLEVQQRLIRYALSSHRPKTFATGPWPTTDTWSPAVALERAVGMGERIARAAVVAGDGAAWHGLMVHDPEAPPVIATLGDDLYMGAPGIGLFLLALARASGRADFQDLGLAALAPLRAALRNPSAAWSAERKPGIGGASGLGGAVYALTLAAGLTRRPELLDDAVLAALAITDERIADDVETDVIGGAAGAVLGLLALHAAGRSEALDRAKACGRRLLAVDIAKARPTQADTRALAGLSHGAAGYALALERLAKASGEAAFSAAAEHWLAYEETLFHPVGNWADIRFLTPQAPEPDTGVCRWCHGAAGIGLARLAMGRRGDPGVERDIARAVNRTLAEPMSDLDTACCGTFGRTALLLDAGLALERPELLATARARAAARLDHNSRHWTWMAGGDDENLGFFQGLSGMGYELLRLIAPTSLPNVLVWEPWREAVHGSLIS